MQFVIGVTILECFFVKNSHGLLGVNIDFKFIGHQRTLEVQYLFTTYLSK
jgi:hypothetical protein